MHAAGSARVCFPLFETKVVYVPIFYPPSRVCLGARDFHHLCRCFVFIAPAAGAISRCGAASGVGVGTLQRRFGRHGERRSGRSVAREVNLSRRDLDSRLAVFFAGRERQQQGEAERMPENADHL